MKPVFDGVSGTMIVIAGFVLIMTGVMIDPVRVLALVAATSGFQEADLIQRAFLIFGSVMSCVGIVLRMWFSVAGDIVHFDDLALKGRAHRLTWILTGVAISGLWISDPVFVIDTTRFVLRGVLKPFAGLFDNTLVPVFLMLWPWAGVALFWFVPAFCGWMIGHSPLVPRCGDGRK